MSAARRKYAALALLVAQNASIALLTRLSRLPRARHRDHGAPFQPFIASTAVFVAEVIKLVVSMTVIVSQSRAKAIEAKKEPPALIRSAYVGLLAAVGPGKGGEVLQVSVPAVLYALQNNLLYIALSNLDSPTYSVVYQLKILSAALFSVILFKRPISALKWLSLCLLTAGVALVQLQAEPPSSASRKVDLTNQSPTKGFLAILAACVSSGLAGSWFEMVLKSAPAPTKTSASKADGKTPAPSKPAPVSLWTRNLQLCIPSLLFTGSGVLLDHSSRQAVLSRGFFSGYDALVWVVIVNQALGGLLVALVVREADSVSKGFATSLAIVGADTFSFVR